MSEKCAWGRCREKSESIWIRGGKRFGYCDKHLDMMLRKEDKISEKRFARYRKLASVDIVEQHIAAHNGGGGRFVVWPIRHALDN